MATIWDKYQEYINPPVELGEKPNSKAITDAPNIYHETCLYTTIGTLIGRKRYIPFGHQKIYPNMWTVILGESSRMHKSTAVSIALKYLRRVKSNLVLPNDFTGEALVETLQKNPAGMFVFFEFATFLENMEKDYNAGTRALLTELFDAPDYYTRETKSGGSIVIENPCLSMMAASTPRWLKMSEKNVQGGLLARVLFVCATPKDKPFNQDFPPKDDIERFTEIQKEMITIAESTDTIEYSIDEEAKEEYVAHCRKIEAIQDEDKNHAISTIFSRQNIYTLKLSMIIQTLLNPSAREIGGVAMSYACNFIMRSVKAAAELFADIPSSKEEGELNRVFKVIERNEKGISRSSLLQYAKVSAKALDGYVETLKQQEKILQLTGSPVVYIVVKSKQ